MKTKKTTLILILLMAGLFLSSHKLFPQQTASQLYEKALYLEEARGELQGAIDLYNQIAENQDAAQSLKAKALLHMGMCYEKLGSEKARQAYRDVINRYPEQSEEAVIARERMTSLDAYVADLNIKAEQHMKQGNELFKMWEYDDAIKEYEDAITLRPNTLLAMNAQYSIGHSLYRAGEYEDAMATFTKLMEENPESNIAPVTELMVSQVQYAMENDNNQGTALIDLDEDTIVDPETGITYNKIKTFTGKNDVIDWTPGTGLSPNGKFLLAENSIVPMDGSDPSKFVDMQVNGPTWSPGGNNIAFTCGDSSIYVVPVSPETGLATGIPKILLKREKDCDLYGVNWSPDSKKLFFHMMDKQEKEYRQIFSLSISDLEIKSLTTANFPQFNPACSPDGNTIAFNGPFAEMWLCSAEGGAAKKLIGDGHTKPHWTPDGKWVFSDETSKGWGRSLNFIRISDEKEFKLTPPVKTGTFASLSPEGDRILFHRSSHHLMWGMKVSSASGGPSYEPVSHLPVYGAQWSKNSTMIIVQGEKYNKMEGDVAMRIVPIAGGESFLLNMNVDVTGKPFAFYVTPDQKRILFKTTKEDELDDLYMAPISIEEASVTGPATRIIENWNRGGAHNTKMSMSNDGSRLAIVDNDDIWIYDMNRKELKQITETPEKKKWVAWSPDDRMISYWAVVEDPDYEVETRIISSDEGNPINTLNNCRIYPSNWSPDNTSVAMLEDDKFIIRNIFNDESRVILDLNTHGLDDTGVYCWSPDGKYLAIDGIVKSDPDRKYHLLKISVDDGKITELATDDTGWKYDMSWSPDGKWICYCYMETEKVRPESTMWEADFEEIKEKLVSHE
jgi:Tol biopolymer transport system component/TolA-binding protein